MEQSVLLKYSNARVKLRKSLHYRVRQMDNKIGIRIFFLTDISSLFFFYQTCNKVIFLKMLPFLQSETHLYNGYSLACKLVLLYILLCLEENALKGPKLLTWISDNGSEMTALCNYCDKTLHFNTRLHYTNSQTAELNICT
jgi:hypothetical protein